MPPDSSEPLQVVEANPTLSSPAARPRVVRASSYPYRGLGAPGGAPGAPLSSFCGLLRRGRWGVFSWKRARECGYRVEEQLRSAALASPRLTLGAATLLTLVTVSVSSPGAAGRTSYSCST